MITKKIFAKNFENLKKYKGVANFSGLSILTKFNKFSIKPFSNEFQNNMMLRRSKPMKRIGDQIDLGNISGAKRKTRMNEVSFPQYLKRSISELYFPVYDEFFLSLMFSIIQVSSMCYLVKDMGFHVPVSVACLSFLSTKFRGVIVVENEEDAMNVLKACENIPVGLAYVRDESDFDLFGNDLARVLLINYKNFADDNIVKEKLVNDKQVTYVFCNIKQANQPPFKKFISNFAEKAIAPVTNYIAIGDVFEELNELKRCFGKDIKVFKIFEETKYVTNTAIRHFGMVVTKENNDQVAYECICKYLRQGKKQILVIFKDEAEIKNFHNYVNSRNGFNNEKSEVLPQNLIFLTSEICENIKNYEKLYKKFDVLIEYKFKDTEQFLERRSFLNVNYFNQPEMITLYDYKQNAQLHELRQIEICKIKVMNLLSVAFLMDENKNTVSGEKNILPSSNSLSLKNPESEFYNKLESLLIEPEPVTNPDFKFEEIYERVKKNEYLLKAILNKFLKQNYSILFNRNTENISLITGKRGFYTCLLTSETSKNLADRYYITKFLVEENLADMNSFDKDFFRVFETFDYICDIPSARFEEVSKDAENKQIKIKILNELPIIFYHQYQDFVSLK